jgi:serine/threonine-protein kinase
MEPAVMSPDAANSPTLTSPAMTQMRMIVGTAASMAPEQARGEPVARRAGIWAFGWEWDGGPAACRPRAR